jgi:hypothetical protein
LPPYYSGYLPFLAEVERRVKGWMNRWREEGGRARESGRGEWKEGVCV